MKNFDEILKEGKDKAKVIANPSKEWRNCINIVMDSLHKLNALYGNKKTHHIKVETYNCTKCKEASFVLAVRDINNQKRIIRYHKTKWEVANKGEYYCEQCKKGK